MRRDIEAGRYPGQRKDPANSRAIIEGLGNCYYPMIDSLDAPAASGHTERWVEGVNIAFGFVESPPQHVEESKRAPHEMFVYVIRGGLQARIGGEKRRVGPGDVLHVPRGKRYRFEVMKREPVRFAAVRSTAKLEETIRKRGAADNWRG